MMNTTVKAPARLTALDLAMQFRERAEARDGSLWLSAKQVAFFKSMATPVYRGAEPDERDCDCDCPEQPDAIYTHSLTIARVYRELAREHPDWSTTYVLRTIATVYAVDERLDPATGRAPAGPDADPDLRVPAGREPDGDDPPSGDAELRAAGGEPGAGAPAVPGGGTVPATLAYEHEYRPRPFRHAHRHAHPDDGRARVNAALGDSHDHAHYPDGDGDHHPL